jgi:alpha-N-arabinofuranosidase
VRDKAGKVHVALSNLNPNEPITVSVSLAGITASAVSGQILTANAINAHNDFDAPNAVAPAAFTGAQVAGGQLSVTLPAKSVVMLTLQ